MSARAARGAIESTAHRQRYLLAFAAVDVSLAPKLGRSTDTYGLLGAATVILLWLYLIARLITVSAFLNATLNGRAPAVVVDQRAGEGEVAA